MKFFSYWSCLINHFLIEMKHEVFPSISERRHLGGRRQGEHRHFDFGLYHIPKDMPWYLPCCFEGDITLVPCHAVGHLKSHFVSPLHRD